MSETFKVVVIGAPKCGKTALISCYTKGKFIEKYTASANMVTTG